MNLVQLYRAEFRTDFAVQLQYRASLLIWLLGNMLEPVIYLAVWSAVARSSGGSAGGYGPGDFAAYFIVLMLVNHATFTWIMWEYDYRIRHGTLSAALLRPIHPIHGDIADNITYKAITLSVLLPTAVLLSIVFKAAYHPVAWAVAAFFPALVLAFAVRFMVEWTLALMAFWTTRTFATNQMYYVAILFLSGQVAPLDLFPAPVQALAALLPFRWMISFPVELALGRLTPGQTLTGFAAQTVWLALALVLLKLVWRAGVKRYSAVGA